MSGAGAADIGMINYAWPAAELENRILAFAERFAIMSSDHLAMLKLPTSRFYETWGSTLPFAAPPSRTSWRR